MDDTPARRNCPTWCGTRHPPGWTIHTRHCGEMRIGRVTYSIDVTQYREDENPVVGVAVFTDDHARVSNCTPEEAAWLHNALGTALNLLGGVACAGPEPLV